MAPSPPASGLDINRAEEIVFDVVDGCRHEEESEVLPRSDLPSPLFAVPEVAASAIPSPCCSPTHTSSPLVSYNDSPLQDSPGFIAPAGSLEYSVAEPVASLEDSYEEWLASQSKGDAEQSSDPNVSQTFEITEPAFHKVGPSQINNGILSVDSMSDDVSSDQSGRLDSAISDEYEVPRPSCSLEDTLAEMAMHPTDKEESLFANVSTPGPDSYESWLASQPPTPEEHTLIDYISADRKSSSPRQVLFGRLTDKESPDDVPDANAPALQFVSEDSKGSDSPRQTDIGNPLLSAFESLAETKGGITDQTSPCNPINRLSAEPPFITAQEALLEPQVDSTMRSEETEDLRSEQLSDSGEGQGDEDAATNELHSSTLINHGSADRKASSPRQLLFGRLTVKESLDNGDDALDAHVPALQFVPGESRGSELPGQTDLGTSIEANPEDKIVKIESPPLLTKKGDDLTSKLKDCMQLWGTITPLRKTISVDDENYSGSEKENGASRDGCDSPVGPYSTVSSLSGSHDGRHDFSREGSPQRPRRFAPDLYIDTMAHLKNSPVQTTPSDGGSLSTTYLEMRSSLRHTPPLPSSSSSLPSGPATTPSDGGSLSTTYLEMRSRLRRTPPRPSSSSSLPSGPAITIESNMRSRNSTRDRSALTTPRPPRTPLHHKVYPDLAPKLQTEMRAGRHVHTDPSTPHRVESSRSQPNLSARGVYADQAPKLETESRAKNRTPQTSMPASSRKAAPLPRVARLAISQSARKYQTPSRHRVYADLAPILVTDSRAKSRESTLPHQPQSPASIPGSLNLIPLRREEMFQKREQTAVCTSHFDAHLHSNMGPCDRCWYLASPAEQAKFKARGTHLCIAKTRAGCDRNCKVFPPEEDEHAVRLCLKCFTATHKQGQLQVYRGKHRKVR